MVVEQLQISYSVIRKQSKYMKISFGYHTVFMVVNSCDRKYRCSTSLAVGESVQHQMSGGKSRKAKHPPACGKHGPVPEPFIQRLGSRVGIDYFQNHLGFVQFPCALVHCLQQRITYTPTPQVGLHPEPI